MVMEVVALLVLVEEEDAERRDEATGDAVDAT